MKSILAYLGAAMALVGFAACSQSDDDMPASARRTPMTFDVIHPAQTRVTDTAFETGDTIGLFVANDTLPLEIGGNLVNNEALTYNGTTWTAQKTLYWDEGSFTAYAYYPYITKVTSIEDLPFTVASDQRHDGYEASDVLYAKTSGVSASNSPVPLTFKHIMSKLTLRLVKSEDFEGEMPTEAEVYVHNVYPAATIDLSAGVATVNGKSSRQTIKARQESDYTYSAIIVPQRLSNRMPLVEVIMKGVSYLYESTFVFKAGMEHYVNLVISDNPDQVKIEIGGEVQNW